MGLEDSDRASIFLVVELCFLDQRINEVIDGATLGYEDLEYLLRHG